MFRYLVFRIGSLFFSKRYRAEQLHQQLEHEQRAMDAALAHFRAIRIHNPAYFSASPHIDDTSSHSVMFTEAECNRLDFVQWRWTTGQMEDLGE